MADNERDEISFPFPHVFLFLHSFFTFLFVLFSFCFTLSFALSRTNRNVEQTVKVCRKGMVLRHVVKILRRSYPAIFLIVLRFFFSFLCLVCSFARFFLVRISAKVRTSRLQQTLTHIIETRGVKATRPAILSATSYLITAASKSLRIVSTVSKLLDSRFVIEPLP